MSQDFKYNIDDLTNIDFLKEKMHSGEGSARNICFVQPDGKMLSLSYGYLISSEYLPDESTITLVFTSHKITLKGTKLQELFFEIFVQKPKVIVCEDGRFKELNKDNSYVVNEIAIEENKN